MAVDFTLDILADGTVRVYESSLSGNTADVMLDLLWI